MPPHPVGVKRNQSTNQSATTIQFPLALSCPNVGGNLLEACRGFLQSLADAALPEPGPLVAADFPFSDIALQVSSARDKFLSMLKQVGPMDENALQRGARGVRLGRVDAHYDGYCATRYKGDGGTRSEGLERLLPLAPIRIPEPTHINYVPLKDRGIKA